jgi:redox-sensitive bicupin YhaK (pirin superfamily)
MTQPAYQEFPAEQIATEQWENGNIIKVIAGCTDSGTQGPVVNPYTQPTYLDIQLKSKTTFTQQLPANHNAFIYMLEGELQLGNSKVQSKQLAILTVGEEIQLQAQRDSRFLLIAGKPLQEPVARYGPFVMNTQAQINQAMSDYQQGKFS